jgi:hypothetical protein
MSAYAANLVCFLAAVYWTALAFCQQMKILAFLCLLVPFLEYSREWAEQVVD